jgi:hypothetical protein
MTELPEAFEPFHVHGSATDVWTRAEINFAELAEKELGPEAKAPQFVPVMPIPQDLPVPPDPPSPSAPAPLAVVEEAERAAAAEPSGRTPVRPCDGTHSESILRAALTDERPLHDHVASLRRVRSGRAALGHAVLACLVGVSSQRPKRWSCLVRLTPGRPRKRDWRAPSAQGSSCNWHLATDPFRVAARHRLRVRRALGLQALRGSRNQPRLPERSRTPVGSLSPRATPRRSSSAASTLLASSKISLLSCS